MTSDRNGPNRRERLQHPLDEVPSIKLKLGFVIAAAVAVTVFVFWLGLKADLWPSVSGVIAAAVAMTMVWFLSRGMTSPLREMAAAASEMARGNYDRRVSTSSRDEVGELAHAFNRMAAELAETDRVRRDLVANVSHELRTPITALQVQLENLVDGVSEPDPDTFATMLAQVERLGRLVKQLLDLSRLESGAVPLERTEFAVEPLLQHAVREQQLHDAGVDVSVAVDAPGLVADGDPERMHQVVANLLENAVRHTPSGGRVEVRAHRRRARRTARRHHRGARRGPGHRRGRPRARVRALLPRRLGARVARRRRRARSRDRAVDRRPARRRHPPRTPRPPRLPHGRHPSGPGDRIEPHPSTCTFTCPFTHEPGTEEPPMTLATIDEALKRIRRGEMVLVVDDEDRENEGDLTLAASWVTPEAVNFMLTWARGLVCMPCDVGRLDELDFWPMVPPDRAGNDTAFTVSIDHMTAGSGIGAADRATTIRRVLDPASRPADFQRPGHVFPLRARPGGVLERRGHTEASVDLARLAGLPPVAVICEVLCEDGSPARFPYLERFAAEHRIAMVSVDQVVEHRLAAEDTRGIGIPLLL